MIKAYGADTVRLFCLFASPPEKDLEWSDQGVEGSFRFLSRIWRLVADHLDALRSAGKYDDGKKLSGQIAALHRKTHQTIRKVTEDIRDRFHFNTAIAAVMELVNQVYQVVEGRVQDKTAWPVIDPSFSHLMVNSNSYLFQNTKKCNWGTLGGTTG